MNGNLQNENPTVYEDTELTGVDELEYNEDDDTVDPLTAKEIFQLIRNINDPEHPLTLQQLHVVQPELVGVIGNTVTVRFTPTIPHCSMATLIGLSIRVKLYRSLSSKFKVDVMITEGTHQSEHAVNKQLNDKERVAAAMENRHLLEVINQCLTRSVK